jgi:hypothetical protein
LHIARVGVPGRLAAGRVHHRLAAGRRDGGVETLFAGPGGNGARDRGTLSLGSGQCLVAVVVAEFPAERNEEDDGGEGGGDRGGDGEAGPQSGATNRNPTPRTVRR